MTHRFSIIISGAALALSASVLAQSAAPLAKEGTFEKKLCFSGPFSRIAVSDTERYGTYTVTGTTQSDNKAFDALKAECIAAYEMRSNVWQHRGYCVFQDASGDKFHGSDTLTTDGGYKVVFLGGTGKFAGFSGEATIRRIDDSRPSPVPGTLQGCRQISSKYKIQPAP
jgi:hypothetical protein